MQSTLNIRLQNVCKRLYKTFSSVCTKRFQAFGSGFICAAVSVHVLMKRLQTQALHGSLFHLCSRFNICAHKTFANTGVAEETFGSGFTYLVVMLTFVSMTLLDVCALYVVSHVYVCVFVCMYVCMYVCMICDHDFAGYVCAVCGKSRLCVCVCVCMYVCMYDM